MAEPERKLGPYTLVSKIGRGAFGVVWLAEKRSSIATTRFALKLPRDEDIDLDAFKHEAAIWLQASGHPNVVPMIEADIYDEQVVIVSEYVTDGSLASWLKGHGGRAPSIEAATELMDGVLAGLSHLHERHIIHRDLKPDNILLQRETPRLADFGIARLLKSGSYSTNVSGTLAYMAPEAFDGKRNEQTDVWSAGVIFYQLLAGRLPYDQSDTVSFVGAIMRHDPPPLPETVPEVLRQIVMKALEREAAKRYATAKEMRRDLIEAERLLWLKAREGREALPVPVKDPQATLVLPPAEDRKAQTKPAIELPPTIPATPQRETDRTAEKTIPQSTFPLELQTAQTIEPTHEEDSAPSPVIPVKARSRSRLWLRRIGGVLLLWILIAAGIYLWMTRDYAKQTLSGHTWIVNCVVFSPDGKLLASASTQEINFWDAQTGALKQTLKVSGSRYESIAFSPDGKLLASASTDGLRLWDVQTGELKQTLTGAGLISVAFSPDGKTLASGNEGYFRTVKLWDVQTGALKQTLNGSNPVAFSPDGKLLAYVGEGITLWDVQTGELKQTLSGGEPFAFSPDGKMLACRAGELVKVWEVQTGELKQTLTDLRIASVAFSPDGKTLACGSWDKTVKLWDIQSIALKQTLIGHRSQVNSVAFSPDGKTLASAGEDEKVRLWHVE